MSKAYPRKWFCNHYFGNITLKKVDRMAESMKQFAPYFDTWKEAHDSMVAAARIRLKKAKAELPAAERHLARVLKKQA